MNSSLGSQTEMHASRQLALKALIDWHSDLHGVVSNLRAYSYCSDLDLVTLQTRHITDVLKHFVAGLVTAGDVAYWAESLEGREDIGYAKGDEEIISRWLFVLSSPDINGPLTIQLATEMLRQVGHAD